MPKQPYVSKADLAVRHINGLEKDVRNQLKILAQVKAAGYSGEIGEHEYRRLEKALNNSAHVSDSLRLLLDALDDWDYEHAAPEEPEELWPPELSSAAEKVES